MVRKSWRVTYDVFKYEQAWENTGAIDSWRVTYDVFKLADVIVLLRYLFKLKSNIWCI